MSVPFSALRSNYPNQARPELFKSLGPDWVALIDNHNYENTCSIRLSIALIKSGYPIKKKYREALTGDGGSIVLKVETMGLLLKDYFGNPWGMSKEPGVRLTVADIPRRTGIIAYHVNWANASGHVDLWHGNGFVGSGSFKDIADGYDIALWHLQ